MRIEPTLMSGLQHTGEHFMGARASWRAIASTHFSQDHGGADRLFGPPRGGVGVRDNEEREERRHFGVEGFRKAYERRVSHGDLEQPHETRQELSRGDRQATRRHLTGLGAVAQGERGLQQIGHGARPSGRGRRQHRAQFMTTPREVRKTRLVISPFELAIRRPAIADDHPGVVSPDERRRFVKPPAG